MTGSDATDRRLFGLDGSGLVECCGQRLLPETAVAFECLALAAQAQGFDLRIASGFRSFDRQRTIWNRKLAGEACVVDDLDAVIDVLALPVEDRLDCVLRFSALPGASRHHWGTDLDVFDAAAVPRDYRVQLNAAEVSPTGVFAALHDWLDERIAGGRSFGFYRPYDVDRGGVAPERWHLSYAPLAEGFDASLSEDGLRKMLQGLSPTGRLAFQDSVEARLSTLFGRYVCRVAPAPDAAKAFVGAASN